MNKKLCVIGLGYIGLPTAAVFAENGWDVTGVDINKQIVDELNKGNVHIEEKGLSELVSTAIKEKRLQASVSPVPADVFIIAVPTPHKDNLTADLTFVEDAVKSLLPALAKDSTIIVESTVPPRTTRDVIAPIVESSGFVCGKDVHLGYCPERVLPGRILTELYENNRIVGGINEQSAKAAADVYRTFVKGKVIETLAENAEMSKLMENTYRDVNIALANELTKISEGLNIDALEVISLANEHPRVHMHSPGPGVGGHCIAVDPYFIIEKAPDHAQLIARARQVNNSMPAYVAGQLQQAVRPGAKIAVFGVAYKGNVGDVRESPAVKVIGELLSESYDIQVYDPHVKQEQVLFKLSSFLDTLKDADMLLILTDHDEFKRMNWEAISRLMKNKNVLDTKNCIENQHDQFNYYNFGNLYRLPEYKMEVNSNK